MNRPTESCDASKAAAIVSSTEPERLEYLASLLLEIIEDELHAEAQNAA